jgi:LPXTG-motif cell wall-anchored protein
MSQGVTFPAPQGVTGGDQVPVPVPPSEEAVAPVAVPSGVAGGDDVPMPVPTPNTESRDSKPELPAFALTPATVSVPATALTPANTISIPVEVPAKVTTTARPESAKPARSNARTEVKNTAGAPDDTAAQLAHTGADETAALAALALALMGTGITLVGVNRRRQTA